MEGMVVQTKRYELRRIVYEREWLPVEGIRARERSMNGFAVLGHEWCLGIGCRGITILANMGIGGPAHGRQRHWVGRKYQMIDQPEDHDCKALQEGIRGRR
jgi:hypothetical protein